jgi:hypothetical protein
MVARSPVNALTGFPMKKPPEGGFFICWQRTRYKRRAAGPPGLFA